MTEVEQNLLHSASIAACWVCDQPPREIEPHRNVTRGATECFRVDSMSVDFDKEAHIYSAPNNDIRIRLGS